MFMLNAVDDERKCSLCLYVSQSNDKDDSKEEEEDDDDNDNEVGNCFIQVKQSVDIISGNHPNKIWKTETVTVTQTQFFAGQGWGNLMSPYKWDDLFSGQCPHVVDGKLSLRIMIRILSDKGTPH